VVELIVREIVDAYAFDNGAHFDREPVYWWMVLTKDQDGQLFQYALPSCTFENLAVEYDLPADDIDELLRIAMLQLHILDPHDQANARTDPAAAKGLIHGGRPVTFGNAASTAQARAAHLERIAWVEQNAVRVTWPKPGTRRMTRALDRDPDRDVEVDPHERLTALKARYKPDRARMERKREQLRQILGRDV
jgi:hypothetical protein